MRAPFRSSLLAGAGAGAAVVAAALAAAPPSASAAAPRIDADLACNAGLYDIIIVRRWPVARCEMDLEASDPADWGDPQWSVYGWWKPTVRSVVVDRDGGTATATVARDHAPSPVWLSWTTQDGTAKAGVDYTAASGELAFDKLAQSFTVPLLDDGDHGDGPKTLEVRFANPTTAYVTPPPALTITLPADASYVPPAPDPDPDPPVGDQPATDPEAEPAPGGSATTPTTPEPSAGLVPAPAGAATATAAAAPAPPATLLAPLHARLEQQRTVGALVAGRARLPVSCAGTCTLTARLSVSPATARRLRRPWRTLGSAQVTGSGRVLVPLRVTARAKRALGRADRPVVVGVRVRATGGRTITARVTLKP